MEKWYIEKVEKILKEVERVFIEESPHLYCLKTLFEIMWYDNQGNTKNERRIKRFGVIFIRLYVQKYSNT